MIEALKAAEEAELASELLADCSFPGLPDPKGLLGEGSPEEQMATLRRNARAKAQAALALLGSKARPEETSAYRAMLLKVAELAANAATEGGFMGFGGERVSAAEWTLLDELTTALAA